MNPLFSLTSQSSLGVDLRSVVAFQSQNNHSAFVHFLTDEIALVVVNGTAKTFDDSFPFLKRSFSVAPGAKTADEFPEGIFAADLSKLFAAATTRKMQNDEGKIVVIESKRLRLKINLEGFRCEWSLIDDNNHEPFVCDRSTQSFDWQTMNSRPRHYQQLREDESFFGLGEVSGGLDHKGRRIRLSNCDAMGYDAQTTQPLYKHIPFYITRRKDMCWGMFYDTMQDVTFDFGCERSNYHGRYRHVEIHGGDTVLYYMIAGPTISNVVHHYTWLTGAPMMPPKWSLGFSGSTMTYTDAPNAQERMAEFLARCKEHRIPCSSFHLSSGYTSIGSRRYVFNWNRSKFPDPEAFIKSYMGAGVRLIPNIKPCLLTDHPMFEECKRNGLFVDTPVQFWGALGYYLDFTKAETRSWWKKHVKSALLELGMAATWNDNNEFEIIDPNVLCGAGVRAASIKPLLTRLMVQASREAQIEYNPTKRPFLVSRAGWAGMQRFCQTWSGDNYTSWKTLRYNLRMGLNLALSGVSNSGHDVGGFSGPCNPSEELFVRWCECIALMPRFSIHSWHDDGSVNEPWMFPSSTDRIRNLLLLRRSLTPYLYHLLYEHHLHFECITSPTFYVFPNDEKTFDECDDFMLGHSLLVAPVVEPNQNSRTVYLPSGSDWYNFHSPSECFHGGQSVVVSAPLGTLPLFARAGKFIPFESNCSYFFPPSTGAIRGEFTESFYDDDGETGANAKLNVARVTINETQQMSFDGDFEKIFVPNSKVSSDADKWIELERVRP